MEQVFQILDFFGKKIATFLKLNILRDLSSDKNNATLISRNFKGLYKSKTYVYHFPLIHRKRKRERMPTATMATLPSIFRANA